MTFYDFTLLVYLVKYLHIVCIILWKTIEGYIHELYMFRSWDTECFDIYVENELQLNRGRDQSTVVIWTNRIH